MMDPFLVGSHFLASDAATHDAVCSADALRLGFPHDWPKVFADSPGLKGLVNKRLRGQRCRAVAIASTGSDPSSSFACAERLAATGDFTVVKGFAVYERIDASTPGSAFVAIRHWWNAAANGSWVDHSPPLVPLPSGSGRVLLVESSLGDCEEDPARNTQTSSFETSLRARVCEAEEQKKITRGDSTARPHALDAPPAGGFDRSPAAREHGVPDKGCENVATSTGASPPMASPTGEESTESATLADADVDTSSAEACLQHAAALRREGVALFGRGHVGGAKGRFDRASRARIAAAEAAKDDGNRAFREADGCRAAEAYERALAALGCGPKPGHLKSVPPQPYSYHYECGVADAHGDAATAEFARVLRLRTPPQLLTALHSNVAAAYLLQQRFDAARAAATAALRVDANHAKARSRRAAACQALGEHSCACDDLALALGASVGTPAAAELASRLVDEWRLRAPCVAAFFDEACARGGKSGAGGRGAVKMALGRSLHGIGSAADWARNTPLPGCGDASIDGESLARINLRPCAARNPARLYGWRTLRALQQL